MAEELDRTNPTGPLAGHRVIDLSSVLMGPLATQTLGDLGADVILVEPKKGDRNRSMGTGPHHQLSGVSMNLLRNKRDICLDLTKPAARDIVLRLAATADVVVTNLRPGSLRRLRLEYDDIAAVRPDIIFCQAAGYPADGPRADDPAYDDVIQAATGVADVMDRTLGEAALVPMLLADKVCGLTIVSSICAALVHRALTGEGQRIEVPMIDVMKAFMMTEHGSGGIAYPRTEPAGYPRILTKQRRPKRTADGWIHMLPYSEDNWSKLLATVGREEMMSDPRFTSLRSRHLHSEFLYGELEKILPSKTTDAWMEFCSEHGIPATRLSTLEDLVDELPLATHPVAGEYRSVPPPVRFSATPADVRRHAPLIGQHNDELLTELGYTDEERRELAATGVIGTGPED